MHFISRAIYMFMLVVVITTAQAQKLPNLQTGPISMPSTLKIDGKPKETDNKFQAYNRSIEAYFTLANNADNIYLVLQATDPLIVKKIIYGGVTLTICPSGKRNDPNPVTITFPVLPPGQQPPVSGLFSRLSEAVKEGKSPDSSLLVLHKKLESVAKEIKVNGIAAISDTLISVYNDHGIKTVAEFDNKAALTCEMLVPMKLFGVRPSKEIAYNIMLSGFLPVKQGVGTGGVIVTATPRGLASNPNLQYPTDCWGKYALSQ